MASNRKYKCPFCKLHDSKEKLIYHIEKKHSDMLPEGFTAGRVFFHYIHKKPFTEKGKCVICHSDTNWNEKTYKYNRLCDRRECKEKLRENYKKNMLRVFGTYNILNDMAQQEKMLKNRSISGIYKFQNGKIKDYVGSYEKKFLEFCDAMLNMDPDDIMMPGPTIGYTYKGQKHQWITDVLIVPYNLVCDIKDGGSNPNNREMSSYREKQIEKEKVITNQGEYNYLRLTDNQFPQLLAIMYELKLQNLDNPNSTKTISRIHEDTEWRTFILGKWNNNEKESSDEEMRILSKPSDRSYDKYLKIHAVRLKAAFNDRIYALKQALQLSNDECLELKERILKHDASRYSEEEWEDWKKGYFPENDKEKEEGEKSEKKAKEHHYKVNAHHPEHWKGKEMDKISVAEMIIDWEADSKADGGNPLKWYTYNDEAKEKKEKLNPKTRELVERVLQTIYDMDMNLKDNFDKQEDPEKVAKY